MAKTSFTLTQERASDLRVGSGEPARLVLNKAVRLMQGVAGGAYGGTTLESAQTQATGTITLSSASGAVTTTINGVVITPEAPDGDDAEAAGFFVSAINASTNPLVANHVTASSSGAVVTITALHPGHVGNAVTLAASGTGVTASGARLTGGTSTTYTF